MGDDRIQPCDGRRNGAKQRESAMTRIREVQSGKRDWGGGGLDLVGWLNWMLSDANFSTLLSVCGCFEKLSDVLAR